MLILENLGITIRETATIANSNLLYKYEHTNMMKKVDASQKGSKKCKIEEVSEVPVATKKPRASKKKSAGKIEETPIVEVDSQISEPTTDELINTERLADELINAAKGIESASRNVKTIDEGR